LHLTGEQEYAVPTFQHEEGVGFFLARARAVEPTFQSDEAVSEICLRLDDLPLALELAAARVKALSSTRILERLDQRLPLLSGGARDLPERQRTLRATIEWSYELLSGDEQRLFARLAVFRSGCTLEAAEQVCDADLGTLESLVDKSLVRVGGDTRFWMLETIREYALEQLEASGEGEQLRNRHAEHFLALAEQAEPTLSARLVRGPDDLSSEWLDRLEREHDNLRGALDWLHAAGNTQQALRLAGALWPFWFERGYGAEARRRLEDVLAADPEPTSARALALLAAAEFGMTLSTSATETEVIAARRRSEEALAIYRALGDRRGMAWALWQIGDLLTEAGDNEGGIRRMEEAIAIFRRLDDPYETLEANRYLGYLYFKAGDTERHRLIAEEIVEQASKLGARRPYAIAKGALALIAIDEGRTADALTLIHEHLRKSGDLDPLRLTASFFRAGYILARAGHLEAAVTLLAAEKARSDEIGQRQPWLVADSEATAKQLRTELGESAFTQAWEKGASFSFEDAVAFALGATAPDP
jgi:tetratricopeptide (TPR) repeat protein